MCSCHAIEWHLLFNHETAPEHSVLLKATKPKQQYRHKKTNSFACFFSINCIQGEMQVKDGRNIDQMRALDGQNYKYSAEPCPIRKFSLEVVTVQVKPLGVNLFEPTVFVQAMPPALHLESGNKFNQASAVISAPELSGLYRQTQPLLLRIKTHTGRAGFGVPTGQKIRFVTFDEGAVARSH
jgi:hypothetical protein